MTHFKIKTFIISTCVVGLLIFISFLAAFAEDEGTLGTNIILNGLANLFYLMLFPWTKLSAGILINILFYGLLTERIISTVNAKKAKTTTN